MLDKKDPIVNVQANNITACIKVNLQDAIGLLHFVWWALSLSKSIISLMIYTDEAMSENDKIPIAISK